MFTINQRMSVRMIGEGMGIDKKRFCQILMISLKKKKSCAKMVPKNLE
jgi:hypothetical protein